MRSACRPCNNRAVRTRSLVVATLCLVVLATRTLGVHAHLSHEDGLIGHSHDSDHHEHAQSLVVTTSVEGAAHVDAHMEHGDIDLSHPAATPGKVATLELLTAVALTVNVLSLGFVATTDFVPLPPYRPPRYPRRSHLLPPAQAPPFAA